MNRMFSIIIPTYNRSAYLSKLLMRLRSCSITGCELIVIDDGSTDNTKEVVEDFKYAKYHWQENSGVSAARNAGVSFSKNKWLLFVDSDDDVSDDWFVSFYKEILDEDCIGYVSCGFCEYDVNGFIKKTIFPECQGPMFHDQRLNYLAGTFAVHRNIFDAVGGYAEELRFAENTELALRIIEYCIKNNLSIQCIDKPLLHYYPSSFNSQESMTAEQTSRRLYAVKYFLEHHRKAFERDKKALANYLAIAGVNAGRLGLHEEAKSFLLQAIKTTPSNWRNYARFARQLLRLMVMLDHKLTA